MKVGIVAEYNPFHNGHLYQLKKIKEKLGENIFLVAIISGDFVQRGEISFLDKWEKTEIALNMGIDLVVELPVYYSIQNAENFSMMSTKILDYLGVDIQIFGAEENKLEILEEIIELQKKEEYKEKLLFYMKKGNSYTNSQRLILEEKGYSDIFKSNNILAMEYIRTIKNYNLNIKPYIIKREISAYNETEIEKNRENIVSATFIRESLKNNFENMKELEKLEKFVPNVSYEKIINKKTNFDEIKEKIYKLLKYQVLTKTKKEILQIYDITEEIYNRIYIILEKSDSYKEFLGKIKSRNYSNKRIDRIMINILLNIDKRVVNKKIDYVRILGFNSKGQEYLKKINKNKIFVNWKDIEKNVQNKKKIKIEKNAFLIKKIFLKKQEKLNPIVKK